MNCDGTRYCVTGSTARGGVRVSSDDCTIEPSFHCTSSGGTPSRSRPRAADCQLSNVGSIRASRTIRKAYCSPPVTANHLSSEPDITKMIGATHCSGRVTKASISESPDRVAGNPAVVMLTVPIFFPFSVKQLTNPRNCVSSLMPRRFGGTEGSFANTIPRTLIRRRPSEVKDPRALPTTQGSSSPSPPPTNLLSIHGPSTPYIDPQL